MIVCISIENNNASWCNGSTRVFGSLSLGSNPSEASKYINMILCEENNLCFVHIPKTAGSSVTSVLKNYTKRIQKPTDNEWHIGLMHDTYKESIEVLKSNNEEDLLKMVESVDFFTIVRHPLDRFISFFCKIYGTDIDNFYEYKFNDAINDYLMNKLQLEYIIGIKESKIKICKFENLNEELNQVFVSHNINVDIPKENQGDPNAINYFKENVDLVRLENLIFEIFYKDYKMFNYSKKNQIGYEMKSPI